MASWRDAGKITQDYERKTVKVKGGNINRGKEKSDRKYTQQKGSKAKK
jgi:hypothetical protein